MQHLPGHCTRILLLAAGLSTSLATALAPSLACSPQDDDRAVDIAGTWLGTVQAGGIPARLVFNITRESTGDHVATLDSPDEGVFAIPVTRVTVSDRQVQLVIDSVGAVFTGQLSGDGQTIAGTATQLGESIPLTLHRQPGPLSYRRPQDPQPPYPYNIGDVTVTTGDPAVRLACTATWPSGPGPFRTAVLIGGSGPQDRNEQLVNHRPFLVLADALARAGIAAFRCDDRGVGQSTGDFAPATTLDFVADVRAMLGFLRGQPPFPAQSIGLVGHSEGALVGPLVADGDPDLRFLVLLAAPGVTGEATLVSQARAIATAQGATPVQLEQADALNRRLFAQFLLTSDPQVLDQKLREVLAGNGLTMRQIDTLVASLNTPWMRFFVPYDPRTVLRKTRIPVLALNGTLDLQVLADLNLPEVESALRQAGNQDVTTRALPGLNHLFQHAATGLPAEYASIEETMSPEVLALIADWINGR